MAWAAAIAAGGGLLSGALNAGMGILSMREQYKMQRKLRRKEYQDAVHSMKRAGINPILAAKLGGSGGTVSAPDLGNFPDLGEAAVKGYSTAQEVKESKSKAALADATALQTNNLMAAQHNKIMADIDTTRDQAALLRAQLLKTVEETGLTKNSARKVALEGDHLVNEMAESRRSREFWESKLGFPTKAGQEGGKALGAVGGAFGSMFDKFMSSNAGRRR